MRQFVRLTGKFLISIGLILLMFVGYQLWGTGIAQARDQDVLQSSLAQALATPAPSNASPAPAPPPDLGDAVALLQIPKIGVQQAVVEGVGVDDLKKGPGRYPKTRMPGEAGNAAIAGHRTTYGAPFFRLNELTVGDPITVTTRAGKYRYEVTELKVVLPSNIEVLDETPDARLTLTTCNPRYSAAQRLIVVAKLIGEAVDPPIVAATPTAPLPTVGPPSIGALEEAGLSGTAAAKGPAFTTGALAVVVWLATWLVARSRRRPWKVYLMGAPVFFIVLFVFFENVSLLLPANI